MPVPSRPPAPPADDPRVAQATAAAIAAAAAAQAVPPPDVAAAVGRALVSMQAVARAVAVIVAALLAFLAARRIADEAFLRDTLMKRTSQLDDIDRVILEEEHRAVVFEQRAADRLTRDMPLALSIPDPAARDRAVRGLLGRERFHQRQRAEAMAARSIAAVDRLVLRRESPSGAFWKLDPLVAEHTAGCLVMGGRFWPWLVLDRVHPPRHPACPCRLVGYGTALAEGLLRPGDILDVADALRAAAGVVMEAAEAEALAREAEWPALREALIESGLSDDETLAEYDPSQQRAPAGSPTGGQFATSSSAKKKPKKKDRALAANELWVGDDGEVTPPRGAAVQRIMGESLHVLDGATPLVKGYLKIMELMPPKLMAALRVDGIHVHVGSRPITELGGPVGASLKGLRPAGYPEDWTWAQVSGIGPTRDAMVVLVGTGFDQSPSTMLHELGHAVGLVKGFDESPELIAHHKRLYGRLDPYVRGEGAPGNPVGRRELLAEGVAFAVHNPVNGRATYGKSFMAWIENVVLKSAGDKRPVLRQKK